MKKLRERFVISLTLAALCAPLLAADAPPLKSQITGIIDKEYPSLEALYEDIHAHPELSWQEERTAKKIASELRNAGFEVTKNVGKLGVVAVLKNGEGKTLLLRTELDALPVREQTGAPYASTVVTKNPAGETVPVAHVCGHDIHMTCIIGTARAMAALKDHWKGTLVIIGQPAEELVAGAKAMIDDGLFTRFPKPDFCLAQHVGNNLAGTYGITPGYAWANSDSINITIRGVGGHGSAPNTTKDPIVLAAQVVLALQTIVSREIKPGEPAVVTVGSIHGGTKHNIIPDEVKLQLTVRTYKDEVRQQIFKAIDRIVKGTAEAAGVPEDRMPTVKLDHGTPSTYNTPELVGRVAKTLKNVLGEENVRDGERSMGAEDFGLYGRTPDKIPICMLRLGSQSAQKIAEYKAKNQPLPSLHSSNFLPEREPTIRTGILGMTAAALDLLAK